MLSEGDFQDEHAFRAYCAARAIWNRRNELTPSAIRDGGDRTWTRWVHEMFGRPIEEVAREYRSRIEE